MSTTAVEITALLKKLEKGQELECLFFRHDGAPITAELFNRVLQRALASTKKELCSQEESLDISYGAVRLTVIGAKAIDSIVRTFGGTNPASTVSILAGRALKGSSTPNSVPPTPLTMIKEREDVLYDNDRDIKVRLSSETRGTRDRLKSMLAASELKTNDIFFRYKHRASVILYKDEQNCTVRVDMTSVKQGRSLQKLVRTPPSYEVELDITVLTDKCTKAARDVFYEAIPKVLTWIQGSPLVISRRERQSILDMYRQVTDTKEGFYQMKAVSLNGDHFINALPHNYAVTDKADGETAFLLLNNGNAFIIKSSMDVSRIPAKTASKGTCLFEGELVDDRLLLLYDCLFFEGTDMRSQSLQQRLECIEAILPEKAPNDPAAFGKVVSALLAEQGAGLAITKKLYLFPKGVAVEEVYKLSLRLWDGMPGLPYKRDGLIFTGIDQFYTASLRDQAYPILKWKPPELNSIDFYVEFWKKPNGTTDIFFDKTTGSVPSDRPFILMKLFVGRRRGGREYPVPFLEKEGRHRAVLYVDPEDQIPRDVAGAPIEDGTVVEMVYDTSHGTAPPERRWRVLRTRHDKTFNVKQNKKQYGNNEDVAGKIWDTICNPVTTQDFTGMASNADQHRNGIRSRFVRVTAAPAAADPAVLDGDAYYMFQTDAAKPMRRFHNTIIKDLLISTYFCPRKELSSSTPKKISVLDIGVGRGGDIMKMANARVKDVVGIDVDEGGLFTSSDCARNRYRDITSKNPGIPPMTFIQADISLPLEPQAQAERFSSMSTENQAMIKKHLGPKAQFHGINCQFMIHYIFTRQGIAGFKQNIDRLLSQEGVLVISTFNAHRVRDYLAGAKEKSSMYIDAEGAESPFFTIRDISVDPRGRPSLEQAIDVFVSLYMAQGSFYTEYLVYPEVLVDEMRNIGLHLIDTCAFARIREMSEKYGSGPIFNPDDSVDRASKALSDLYDIYVFQKRGTSG